MTKNSPESALIRDLGPHPYLAHKSFGNGARFPVFLPCHLSPDCTLNRLSRLLSPPDRKFPLEKEGRYCSEHLATQEWLRADSEPRNRLLSTLISSLETLGELSRNSFGIVRFFPSPSEHRIAP
jgi:hypothetical protein